MDDGALMQMLARIEAKVDTALLLLARPAAVGDGKAAPALLARLTVKQHAAMQMVIAGCGNKEIAQRLGVGENTAKLHVRAVAQKMGVKTRSQVAVQGAEMMRLIDDAAYRMVSGGLPKDWNDNYDDSEPDPYRSLYAGE